MGSTSAAATMLFCCVALSIVTGGFASHKKNPGRITVHKKNHGEVVVPKKNPGGVVIPNKSPKFISMDALECSYNITETSARKLADATTDDHFHQGCPVQFDHTRGMAAVIRSCRGFPSPVRCCAAFKAYACPYSDLLNDNSDNGCASAMFFEIIVRGRLRPGIFSQLCTEGPQGLQC